MPHTTKEKSEPTVTLVAPKKKPVKRKARRARGPKPGAPKYPRHSLERALRAPKAILDQNAGKACTNEEAAGYVGIGNTGEFASELGSAIKYGLLERPSAGKVQVTDLAKRILKPQQPKDELEGLREAALKAPDISDVYSHFRGENLPDQQFLVNTLTDRFKIPADMVGEFSSVFRETLTKAKLLEEHDGRQRVLDVAQQPAAQAASDESIKRMGKTANIAAGATCFVVMPFAEPIGGYYQSIYEPAIVKAGLRPVRADTDIFATGKIMEQVWEGITQAKVLVAELTSRNPNVFYELGLAHAMQKPVVLVSSNEDDVPFDLKHIRVIYYDVKDPFWGDKLIKKVAENVLSALNHPEEAMFKKREGA
jgi:hypothetical protein